MILFVLGYALLVWFASCGLSRFRGFEVNLAAWVAMVLAIVAWRKGKKGPVFALGTVAVVAAATVAAMEVTLRAAPGLLSGTAANCVYSGYQIDPAGIYDLDRHLGWTLRPGIRRRIAWNGHRWTHRANAAGYRGPLRPTVDAVFLGDSLIYGHGVEAAETVPSRFEARSGCLAANLGQQGTGPIQFALQFERLGVRLRPRVVFACLTPNDVEDANRFYDRGELERYLATPAGEPIAPVARPAYWPAPRWDRQRIWDDHFALPLLTPRAVQFLRFRLAGGATPGTVGGHGLTPPGRFVPPEAERSKPFDPCSGGANSDRCLAWRADVRALERVAQRCRERGSALVLFDLGYPAAFTRAVERVAGEIGAAYSPVGRIVLEHGLDGEPVYLENDGHWSPRGCDLVARELTRWCRRRP